MEMPTNTNQAPSGPTIQDIYVNRPIAYCQDYYDSCNEAKDCQVKVNNAEKVPGENKSKNFLRQISNNDDRFNCCSLITDHIPILKWLPRYKWRSDFLSDLIAGTTVLALNIPQGLAYGHLAGVGPIHGLYVSLFPVLFYTIFGTSKHISIGTFSVISIACEDVIHSINHEHGHENLAKYEPIDILITLCLLVGILQLILGIFRLGVLSVILSETLISAFIVGSAVHVFANQMFDFVGIDKTDDDDFQIPLPMDLVNQIISFFSRIHLTNIPTLILSLICLTSLIVCRYFFEPFLMKIFKLKTITLPIDILIVIVVTLLSYLMDFEHVYHIKTMPDIPKGFADMPKIPDTTLMLNMLPKAMLICLISYLTTLSLGRMYAKKLGYKVDDNQELIALGMANIFASFFQCFPCCASLSRSAVQERVGGRTQLVNIISSLLMVIVILFLSTYLRTLPKCVLSTIISVAMFSTLQRIHECKQAWQTSVLDGILWLVTFVFVLLFGVDNGLLYAIVFSIFILILKLIIPRMKLKYRQNDTELFLELYDCQFNNNSDRIQYCLMNNDRLNNRVIIIEYQGPLMFINALYFRNRFYQNIGRHLIKMSREQQRQNHYCNYKAPEVIADYYIIFDCSRMTFIDSKGVEALIETIEMMENYQVKMLLSSCSSLVYEILEKNKFFNNYSHSKCPISNVDAMALIENESKFEKKF